MTQDRGGDYMCGSTLKTEEYDIPVKTLELGKGVTKVLPAAVIPQKKYDESDRLSLDFFGTGLREGDAFIVPSAGYSDLYELFDDAPEAEYSSKDGTFSYRSEKGRFLSLDEVVNSNLFLGDSTVNLKEVLGKKPEGILTMTSGGRSARIMFSQLMDGKRFFYPQLTSEQILAGMKPADSRGARTDAGLLRIGTKESGYRVIFVIGQRNWNDITENLWVELKPGGASLSLEYLPEERKEHNVMYIGPLGGETRFYRGSGAVPVEITAKQGELVRFNLDNSTFLNKAKMYYKFSLDGEDCGDPSPEDGYIYNTRIPVYFGTGTDYPNGIILPPASEHDEMTIKMLAFGAECPGRNIDIFRIQIVH